MRPIIGITCGLNENVNSIGIEYISAIEESGGTPIALTLVKKHECIDDFISIIDGLLLSGGVDADPILYNEEPHPALGRIDVDRDNVEIKLILKAISIGLPIFGICRGIQMLNVAAGGTLYQDINASFNNVLKHRQNAPGYYGTHTIEVHNESRLLKIIGHSKIRVNSFHHQAIKEVAPGFTVSAVANDGIIEGIESINNNFAIGVQFHPELMWQNNPPINALFTEFICEARTYKLKRNSFG